MEAQFPEINEEERLHLGRLSEFSASYPVVDCNGVRVQLGPHIDPYLIYLICSGAYEHGDLDLIEKYVLPSADLSEDFSVVLGGGIGVIASALALKTKAPVRIYEANPALIEHIEHNGTLNSVKLDVLQGLVLGGAKEGEMQDFHISEEFWASSAKPNPHRQANTIRVPCVSFADALRGASIAFIDIEGAEKDLDMGALKDLRQLFLEIHSPTLGNQEESRIMNNLWEQGFRLQDRKGLTQYWSR